MDPHAFLGRVLPHLPAGVPGAFQFAHWGVPGLATDEAVAVLAVPGLDPARVIDRVMDVDHYVGNLDHVVACRAVADARYTPPAAVRFYQRIDVPVLGALHHELVLHRLGDQKGWHAAGWDILRAETDKLSPKEGFRSDYSHGLWLARPGVLAYALGSAPKRDDVGFLKWKALTTGADAAAPRVLRANLEAMAKWAR